MAQVTGIPLKFPTQPLGKRAMSIPGAATSENRDYMMKVFGRNDLREVICERDTKPSVAQVMHLVSGDTIQRQITAKDGNLDAWLADPVLTDRADCREHLSGCSDAKARRTMKSPQRLAPLATGDRQTGGAAQDI